MHHGMKVCQRTFSFLNGIGKFRLDAIRSSYLNDGRHGNTGKQPSHAFSVEEETQIVSFIQNYAEANAILLPGRIPGYKHYDMQMLPSSISKRNVYLQYVKAKGTLTYRLAAETTFYNIWRKYLPHVIITKPMTDLCWQCQHNSAAIVRSLNSTMQNQSTVLERAKEHVDTVRRERNSFRCVLKETSDVLKQMFTSDDNFLPPLTRPITTLDIKAHYSFDYAQQVHFPSNPLLPGPLYFLTPRKCGIFGICCEAIPQQVNFLIDEYFDTGKGANTLIKHGLNASCLSLNADNCAGQNKNNAMIQYLMWRVLTRQNKSITISFLPAGHTKFSPDWCFGLVKQKFRKTEVGSLKEIATVVEESASVNIAQLVGTQEGELIVPTYSWSSFLSQYFKRIPGIKKIHHFMIQSPEPSEIQLKQSVDSSTVKMTLLRSPSVIPPDTLPPVISPRGLSPERQWYLFDKIREYCPLQLQDITCPLPDVPRAFTPCPSPEPDFVTQGNPSPLHRTQTRPRVCGLCGISGHNRRTCPNGESTS